MNQGEFHGKNYVIACGGTGGHLFPGMAVGERLVQRGARVMLLISRKEVDALAVQNRSEFEVETISAMAMPPFWSPALLSFFWKGTSDLRACRRLFRNFQPSAVLGMGGFTSTAPVLAARSKGIRTLIHESNAVAGRANRLNARWADEVLLGLAEAESSFPGRKCHVTGTPVRTELCRAHMDPAEARRKLGLDPERPTLLVIGGSQGARGVNQALFQSMTVLKELGLQVAHLTGPADEQLARSNYRREEIPALVQAFSNEMDSLYSAATLVVGRAGAGSLSELACYGLPAILIPYPFAADNHQLRNAEIVEKSGAARIVQEGETAGEELSRNLHELISNSSLLQEMAQASAKLFVEGAADQVAERLEVEA